jgi:hypothetical protein
MPPIVGWSIFVLLGGFFLVIATNNVVLVWRQFVLKQESTPSVLPFIGGTLGWPESLTCGGDFELRMVGVAA